MADRKVTVVDFGSKWRFPKPIKNVAVYCRVSTGMREQLESLAAQISYFVQLTANRFDYKLVDVYIDVKSGEAINRVEFNRMMADSANGRFDVLLTKSISRFGRNTTDTLQALRKLKERQIQVIFEQESIDTFRDDSEFIITVIEAFAQQENESRRENQLWAIQKRLEDGTSELYSRTCYGYKKQNSIISTDSIEAATVQMIFQEYLNGESIVGIQKMLQEQGIKSPRGNDLWSKKSIENILENEKYMGNVIVRKTIASEEHDGKRIKNLTKDKYMIEGFFPALITKEIFDAVQAERERRSNVIKDELGTRRKATRYSSKKKLAKH